MRKSIKLPEGTEEIWRKFRMMCLKKQTGGDGLANRQLVVLMEAWLEGEGINPEAVRDMLEACVDAESAMFHVLADRGFNSHADRDAMEHALIQTRKAIEAAKAVD